MAFAGQIILSSSPSRVATPPRRSITPISSSPLLPSPSQLFATKLASKKDARVKDGNSNDVIRAEIGATAVTRSVPALDHLREAVNGIDEELEGRGCLGSTKRKKDKPKKSKASGDGSERFSRKLAACETAAQKRKSRSAVPAESSESSNQTGLSAKQAVEKKSTKKSSRKSQSKIEGGRITKPGVTCVAGSKKGKSASSITKSPQHDTAQPDSLKQKADIRKSGKESLDLLLAEAVRRRRAWTPPKDTPVEPQDLAKLGREANETLALETQEPRKPTSGGFENLLGDFGYTGGVEGSFKSSDQGRNTTGEALTKRRKLEVSR